jgi:hypothetical protein
MDLAALWRLHQSTAFPADLLGRSTLGVPLVTIDAAAGAALTASLGREGIPRPLSLSRRAALEAELPRIESALADPGLPGEGRAYFERLRELAGAVLRA